MGFSKTKIINKIRCVKNENSNVNDKKSMYLKLDVHKIHGNNSSQPLVGYDINNSHVI